MQVTGRSENRVVFSGVFGALVEGDKERPKTQHARKRRFSERSFFITFCRCVAFRGAFCSPPWSSIPWSLGSPWSFQTKEILWCFGYFLSKIEKKSISLEVFNLAWNLQFSKQGSTPTPWARGLRDQIQKWALPLFLGFLCSEGIETMVSEGARPCGRVDPETVINLAWNVQCWPSELPTNRALVGGSLEMFNLAWKLQSRREILILSSFGPLGLVFFLLPNAQGMEDQGSEVLDFMHGSRLHLWSGRPPNYTELQQELEWPKSDSKVTRADRPQSDPKMTQRWLQTPFSSHFWVACGHSGLGPRESLLSHFWVTLILSVFLCS